LRRLSEAGSESAYQEFGMNPAEYAYQIFFVCAPSLAIYTPDARGPRRIMA
jgi:hypothetical protein